MVPILVMVRMCSRYVLVGSLFCLYELGEQLLVCILCHHVLRCLLRGWLRPHRLLLLHSPNEGEIVVFICLVGSSSSLIYLSLALLLNTDGDLGLGWGQGWRDGFGQIGTTSLDRRRENIIKGGNSLLYRIT